MPLTENVSSWIELVVFLFHLFLFFLRKSLLLHSFSRSANIDLPVIVKRLHGDVGRWRCDWFEDYIFDVLVSQFTSQNPRLHLGVWDGCRQEEESE